MKRFLLIFLMLCLLTGCENYRQNSSIVTSSKQASVSGENVSNSHSLNTAIHLTKQQMLEDYDYFWRTIEESFPFVNVAKRQGKDAEKIKKLYREKIEKEPTEESFYHVMLQMAKDYGNNGYMGHLRFLNKEELECYREIYHGLGKEYEPWFSTLNDKTVENAYQKQERFRSKNTKSENHVSKNDSVAQMTQQNISVKVIENKKIACIKINTFLLDPSNQEVTVAYKNKFNELYRQLQNYENVIFDITENNGGNDSFWMVYLVGMNIRKPISWDTYVLCRNSENNKKFYDAKGTSRILKPIAQLPYFSKIHPEDLRLFDTFYYFKNTLQPDIQSKNKLKAKLWLLVDDTVYSASEGFAAVCKKTGFATLVGTQTSGDGIGANPVLAVMPNSRLILFYSSEYGLNEDGTCNAEVGTMPDIVCKDGQTPLDACLKAINSQN